MEDYKIKDEYNESALIAIFKHNNKDIYCEILDDLGNSLKVKGQFKTARVMPKKEVKIIEKSKMKYVY